MKKLRCGFHSILSFNHRTVRVACPTISPGSITQYAYLDPRTIVQVRSSSFFARDQVRTTFDSRPIARSFNFLELIRMTDPAKTKRCPDPGRIDMSVGFFLHTNSAITRISIFWMPCGGPGRIWICGEHKRASLFISMYLSAEEEEQRDHG